MDTLQGEGAGLSTSDVSRKFGVSLRQLQWWDEEGLVCPRQEGGRRLYSQADVEMVGIVSRLKACGYSIQRIRQIAWHLRKHPESSQYGVVGQKTGVTWHQTMDQALARLTASPEAFVLIALN